MLNNQIIVTDDGLGACAHRRGHGVIDAALLSEPEWQQLRRLSAEAGGATKARLIKCAKCWLKYGSVQWLSPKENHLGTRVLAHQPGEGRPDHAYEAVEGPQHRAWKDRYFRVGEEAGLDASMESRARDGKTISDVAITGILTLDLQHQHSPFSATHRYSAPERTRRAAAADRTSMWHTTNDKVRGQVPILRTDGGLPLEVIENTNYRHEFRGGIYRIEIYRCDVRWGHECPEGRFSGCGKPHARGQITATHLDDVIRGAPMAKFLPMYNVEVVRAPQFFWTDAESYVQYLAYIGELEPMPLLGGAPAAPRGTRNGARRGHSASKEAELETMRAQAVDLRVAIPRASGQPAAVADPTNGLQLRPLAETRPTGPGICSHWIGPERRYCRVTEAVRHYLPGHRCPAHTPAALKGQPESPERPGWGAGSRGER